MRKLLPLIVHNSNGMAVPPSFLPPSNASSSLTSPSPSPSPSVDVRDRPILGFASEPFADGAFVITTLLTIACLLLLSLLSDFFVVHLKLRSRQSQHLKNFNSFWTVRLMLVMFGSLWALNELLRLPIFRRKDAYSFFPLLTLTQQTDLCKLHVVLSFGLFQPSFLVTLLFLVSISVRKKNPRRVWALASVFVVCGPILFLQILFVFYTPFKDLFPRFMHESSVLSSDVYGNKTVVCTYPLFSCIILGAFAIAYSMAFLISCWRVASFVINKSIRVRINVLTFTVMISLTVQILCLGISPLWLPQDPAYCFVTLAMFLAVACCIAVGEVILVIRPIAEALAAGGDRCRCSPEIRLGRPQFQRDQDL